jgi:hypothetical protein
MSNRNLSLQQHLDAGQLPMFMTGGEIQKHYQVGDYEHSHGETDADVWKRKEESAHLYNYDEVGRMVPVAQDKSLAADILKNGVKKPVAIHADGRLAEGHHRTAVMAKNNPNGLVPLSHYEF